MKKDELTAALMIKKDELLAAVAERDQEIERLSRELERIAANHDELSRRLTVETTKCVAAETRITQLEAELERLGRLTGECICRTTSCQHGAHLHHNGVCKVCNKGICWC
jgi:SMC interacting uncharacterized protein involved in chromosome segregation